MTAEHSTEVTQSVYEKKRRRACVLKYTNIVLLHMVTCITRTVDTWILSHKEEQ